MSQSTTEHQVRKQLFTMLYEDYQEQIVRYLVVKWVHNEESASELCQETFEQLWEYLCRETVVKQYAYYKNWLYKTAKYRAIDYLRKQNKPIAYLSQSEGETNSWFDELRAAGHEELIEDLMCTQYDLLQLPPHQRDSLVEYAKGFKQKEIAAKKGISESAVSAYMSLGRTSLRNKKYFVVEADLKERKRVSEEIELITYMIVNEQLAFNLKVNSIMLPRQLAQLAKGEALLDPPSIPDVTPEDMKELESKLAPEIDHLKNLIIDHIGKGSKYTLRSETDTYTEPFSALDLQTENDRIELFKRHCDRTLLKPWRRVLIDVENKKRGLLSDTAVLGSCGQYRF